MMDEIFSMHSWFTKLMLKEMRKHEDEKLPWTDPKVGLSLLSKNIVEHENFHDDAMGRGDLEEALKQAIHIANNYMMTADLLRRQMED